MTTPTACVLVIGNEILSGRTQDINLNYLATKLGAAGIPVREARVIPDIPEVIISTLNEVRARFTYVFTTGGIGPTHDDITAQCVADAFGVPLERHPEALRILTEYYSQQGIEINDARARMANIPQGGILLENPVSRAPGFQIGNVFVLAGVPRIMQAIFDLVLPRLQGGAPIVSRTVTCTLREGDFAMALEAIQKDFPHVDIGSYPNMRGTGYVTMLICKSSDATAAEHAAQAVAAMVRSMGEEPELS